MGYRPDLNRDFGNFGWQSLAGSQVEGNPLPAPVVDKKFECCIRFRKGIRCNIGLFPIGLDTLSLYPAGGVLAPVGSSSTVILI